MRYALRTLLKTRGITFAAVLALALGIGANTAIFSVVNAVFLRPLPYPGAGRLVEISETSGQNSMSVSYPNYLDWRSQVDVFEHLAANAPYDATLEVSGNAERLPVNYVSADFLTVLRTKPRLGRDFKPEDDQPGAAPVAMLTNRLWQIRLGSNPAVLGSTISVDRRRYTVIGVLPPEYHFYRGGDILVPISDAVTRQTLYMRENHNNMYVLARLKPGVTLLQAQAQMSTVAQRLASAYPASNTGIGARVTTLRERVAGEARRPVMMLLGAVCLVLLIACVNVANLLLARAADRRKEMAMRAALGASSWQVLRQLLLESVLLGVAGGALGLLLARWSFAGLLRLVPASIAAGGLSIDFRVLGFTLIVSILTGVLFGMAPAFDASRLKLNDALREGGRTAGGSARRRLRDALVVAEVALALVLLVGAGLLFRTLHRLMSVPLGFNTEKILSVRVSLPDTNEFSAERGAAFFEQLVARAQNMPGVSSAGIISHMPLSGFFSNMVLFRDDRPIPERGNLPNADQRTASPEYFRTMGVPLLRGRLFTPADGRVTNFRREALLDWLRQNHFSVVISEAMARQLWPGEDPIGKTFRPGFPEMNLPPVTVIGVVGDVRDYGADTVPTATFYWSAYHFPRGTYTLVLRTHTEPTAPVSDLRRLTAELDRSAILTDVATVEQLVSDSLAPRRLNMLLLAIFAGLALLLSGVGIYGVMAYAVNQRSHEIGIRMALGASGAAILRMVLGKAVLLGGLGVLIGATAAIALTRLIASMLYGVEASDPLTFLTVAVLLFAVAVGASYAPARRATRVSPLTALRVE
ncbi:MAG TPA: ABC transporter permease [Bryobacteraceae bacterium]|nr:ABC transporter permease [Bryobacteraceae bacterium]